MSKGLSKVHYWQSRERGRTVCGIYCFMERNSVSEASTAHGFIVQVVGGLNNKATCKSCIRLAPFCLVGTPAQNGGSQS